VTSLFWAATLPRSLAALHRYPPIRHRFPSFSADFCYFVFNGAQRRRQSRNIARFIACPNHPFPFTNLVTIDSLALAIADCEPIKISFAFYYFKRYRLLETNPTLIDRSVDGSSRAFLSPPHFSSVSFSRSRRDPARTSSQYFFRHFLRGEQRRAKVCGPLCSANLPIRRALYMFYILSWITKFRVIQSPSDASTRLARQLIDLIALPPTSPSSPSEVSAFSAFLFSVHADDVVWFVPQKQIHRESGTGDLAFRRRVIAWEEPFGDLSHVQDMFQDSSGDISRTIRNLWEIPRKCDSPL